MPVELAGEAEAGRHTRHDHADETVQVVVSRNVELEGTGADVVCEKGGERLVSSAWFSFEAQRTESFVVDACGCSEK